MVGSALVAALVAGCAPVGPVSAAGSGPGRVAAPRSPEPLTAGTRSSTPPGTTTPAPTSVLSAAVARAVADAGDLDLGLAVLDLDTGEHAGHRDDVPFRSASLSKLLVALDVLAEGDVADEDRELLRRALSDSDDEAMNALWTSHDGPGAVRRTARRAGLAATRPPEDPAQWGDVETTADDLVRLYHHVLTDLPAADRVFVVGALSTAPGTAADGFDQSFGLLAPDVGAYAKQGWMWYFPTDLYLHSAGVLHGRYAVALLSVHSDTTAADARTRLTGVTRALVAGLPG